MNRLICFAVVAVLLLGFSARAQKGADTDSPQLLVDDRETVLKIPHDWYYENPGNIEIYTDTGLAGKISKRKLKASLRRMGS